MDKKDNYYEIIVSVDDTKNWFDKLTDEESYQLILKTYRSFRNQKLKSTDIYMSLTDRYTSEEIEQLKIYRQQLRDMIDLNKLKANEKLIFPIEPLFISKKINNNYKNVV